DFSDGREPAMSNMRPLDPPVVKTCVSEEFGELAVHALALSVDNLNAPVVQAEVWNGQLVHGSRVRLGIAEDRLRFAKMIVRKLGRERGVAPSDDVVDLLAAPLEHALLELSVQLRQVLAQLQAAGATEPSDEQATYAATPDGLVYRKPEIVFGIKLTTADVVLTNFTATIVEDVLQDDGV